MTNDTMTDQETTTTTTTTPSDERQPIDLNHIMTNLETIENFCEVSGISNKEMVQAFGMGLAIMALATKSDKENAISFDFNTKDSGTITVEAYVSDTRIGEGILDA